VFLKLVFEDRFVCRKAMTGCLWRDSSTLTAPKRGNADKPAWVSLQDGRRRGHQIDLNGELVDKGVYYYWLPVAQQGYVLHFFGQRGEKKQDWHAVARS
jgi:hypothetical protein